MGASPTAGWLGDKFPLLRGPVLGPVLRTQQSLKNGIISRRNKTENLRDP